MSFLIDRNGLAKLCLNVVYVLLCVFSVPLSIIHIKYVKIKVNRLRLFSKRVLATIFPTVFIPKRKRKTHKIIFTTFIGIKHDKSFPFMSSKTARKRLIKTDIISNTNISISFSSLPPQVTLYGIIFSKIAR